MGHGESSNFSPELARIKFCETQIPNEYHYNAIKTDGINLGAIEVALLAGPSALLAAPDYYELPNIKQVDQDLYRTVELVIVTVSCLHVPTGEEALLKYEGPGEYTIVWQDKSTCEVLRVLLLD